MRRFALGAVLLVMLAAGVMAAAGAAASRGRVRMVTLSPLVVRGTGFAAHERVVVTVRSGPIVRIVEVRSSASGGFTAHFERALPTPRCGTIAITAIGSRGEHVGWTSRARMCGAALGP